MALTFHELKGKTLAQLRDIAKDVKDERVQGFSQMNKDHLLPALCNALGIEGFDHQAAIGIDKSSIKSQMRDLKKRRQAALESHDQAELHSLRRQLHHLNHQIRSHMH